MNIFEQAAKQKIRFQSDRGLLTVEQLYDLSLQDLDTIARAVNNELKSLTEESFIAPVADNSTVESVKLDILKHIIAVKLAAIENAKQAKDRAEKRAVLLQALASKENEEVNSMSKEEILKKLEEI